MDKRKTGNFIKEKREKCGLTQSDLAKKLYTSRENISKWERGLAIPNTEYLKKLCEILQCDVIDLLSAGERNRDAEKIIYDLIDRHIIFVKKVIFAIAAFTLFFAIYFFVTYFTQNYNSVKLYNISGDNNGYKVLDSLLLINKKKCIFIFSGSVAPDGKEIKEIIIYYDDIENSENIIYKGDSPTKIMSFDVKDLEIEKIEKDLKVQMITNDGVITFDLEVELYYKNNHLLADEKNYQSDLNSKQKIDLPNYIDDKFTYDYKTDSYVYTYTEDEIKVKIEYDYQTKNIVILETIGDLEIKLSSLQSNFLLLDDMSGNKYYYDTDKRSCIGTVCTLDELNLIETYLKKYDMYFQLERNG